MAGIVLLAFGDKFDCFWWIGLILSAIGLLVAFIQSIKDNKKIIDIESKQKATDRAFNIIRDENFNVTETKIDCGEY